MSAIFGASLLRNGIQYDYPFRESLKSLEGICEHSWLALGKSEDGSEAAVAAMPRLTAIPTVWDETSRKSGLILSEQTNIALSAIRAQKRSGWILYLQADEVFSDQDFAQIKADLAQAEREGCDAVSFRYLHFWHSYERIAFARRWYPQEIRAIRVESPQVSYGDAQSFQGSTKIFASNVPVFHYGHVREAQAYAKKQKEFHRWWHSDDELEKVWKKGNQGDKLEPSLRYLGPHASFMRDRMRIHGASERVIGNEMPILVWGSPQDWSPSFHNRILHKNLNWTLDLQELKKYKPEQVVLLDELRTAEKLKTFFAYKSHVPEGMLRKDARPWSPEFRALMKFSERRIALA